MVLCCSTLALIVSSLIDPDTCPWFFDLVIFSLWLVYLFLYELVVSSVSWKAQKLSLVLELSSEMMLG